MTFDNRNRQTLCRQNEGIAPQAACGIDNRRAGRMVYRLCNQLAAAFQTSVLRAAADKIHPHTPLFSRFAQTDAFTIRIQVEAV